MILEVEEEDRKEEQDRTVGGNSSGNQKCTHTSTLIHTHTHAYHAHTQHRILKHTQTA